MSSYTSIHGVIECESKRDLERVRELAVEHGIREGWFTSSSSPDNLYFNGELKDNYLDKFISVLKILAEYIQVDEEGFEWNIEGVFNLISMEDNSQIQIFRILDGKVNELQISGQTLA